MFKVDIYIYINIRIPYIHSYTMLLWISLHELSVHGNMRLYSLDSYLPCLAAQGWVTIGQHELRWRPDGKGCFLCVSGSELRVLLLELELSQLFSSHW